MNNHFTDTQLHQALNQSKEQFEHFNKCSGSRLVFVQEASFIYNIIAASSSWQQSNFAQTNLKSVIDSFLNIAKTGLTLEPNQQLCYIKSVYNGITSQFETEFDFTYRGYLKLISRSKLVKIITADVIYEKDHFVFNGTRELVEHKVTCLSTSQRGNFFGGYCSSELTDNSIITTVMSPEEILCIEDNAKRFENSAWNTPFVDELRRKTLIRRHWKTLSTIVQTIQENSILNIVDTIHQEIEDKLNTKQQDQTSLQERF